MRTGFVAALLILVALPAFPQEKLVESIEVRVVNVDVVVRDRSGKPVTGLSKEDFVVFDRGEQQEITNLYEVRTEGGTITAERQAGATPAAPAEAPDELRQRKLIVFIDNYSILPMRRNAIFEALDRFVERTMRPGDQTMIVFWNRDLEVITPFTSDRQVLRAGISSLAQRSNAGFTNQQSIDLAKRHCTRVLDAAKTGILSWADAYDQSMTTIDSYAEEVALDSQRMLGALRKTTGTLAGLEGKKVLVLAGAHLPERPGAELYQWMYEQFSMAARMNVTSSSLQLASTLNSPISFDTALLHSINGSVGNMQRMKIRDAAREASANGVTLYTIDAADDRDSISAEKSGYIEESEKFTTYVNSAASYSMLARITGGVAVNHADNFDAAFRTIGEDLNSYYSIGYKPAEISRAGEQRKIVVKAKNPAYRIRFREVYSQKTSEEQMDDRVLSNLYNAETKGEWPLQIRAGTPVRDGKIYKVPVEVLIAPTITLIPRENDLVGGFTLFLAVGNPKGGMSDVSRAPRRLNIPPEAEKQLRSRPMSFSLVVMMAPGENTLSVGVLDQISAVTGFARTGVSTQ